MEKRVCVQVSVKEKIRLLRIWKAHPEWSSNDAPRELSVKKSTLRGWRNKYWDRLDIIEDTGDRMREKGGGRKHRFAPYEERVIEYYDTWLREHGTCSFDDLLTYCQSIEEFQQRNPASQKTWVRRFITIYKPKSAPSNTPGIAADTTPSTTEGRQVEDGATLGSDLHEGGGSCVSALGDLPDSSCRDSGERSEHGGDGNKERELESGRGYDGRDKEVTGEESNCGESGDEGDSRDSGEDSGDHPFKDAEKGTYDYDSDYQTEDLSVIPDPDSPITIGGPHFVDEKRKTRLAQAGLNSSDDDSEEGDDGKEGDSGEDSDRSDASFTVSDSCKSTVPSSSRMCLRERRPKNVPLLIWSDISNPLETHTVHVFPDDLDSLLPGVKLTETALDYAIYRFMARERGKVYTCATILYQQIESARFERNQLKKCRLFNELNGMVDWGAYPYVLLPVSGLDHWSLLVVENPMQAGPMKMYHVNPLRGAHDPSYAFDTVKWFLDKEREKSALGPCEWSSFAYNTKPQQTNAVDCGIYVLHYMQAISDNVLKLNLNPDTLMVEQKMEEWTHGGFNNAKAVAFRYQLHKSIVDATH